MSWKIEMVALVRGLINDYGSTLTYEDDQLEEIIVYSAPFVINENTFDYTYDVDLVALDISPDPTSFSSKDFNFMSLVALKAAASILRGEMKTAAAQSFRITDGPSTVDATGSYKAKKELYDAMIDDYNRLRLQHQAGNSKAGQAVMTPYTQENLYGRNPLRGSEL